MTITSLRPKTFYNNATTSSNGSWIAVDSAFSGVQQRTVFGNKHTNDIIEMQLRITDGAFSVVTTATSWGSGTTSFGTGIEYPFHDIRIRKLGENGAANVIGIL